MSLNAAAISILVERGMSAADILALAKALEQTPTRSKGAERQARYRANQEAQCVTGDVTNDVTGDVTAPPKENISNPLPSSNDDAVDPEKVVFDQGIKILSATGVGETKARSLLGKWKRDHGAPTVISALSAAKREGALEPVAFIEAALKVRAKAQAPPVWDGMP